MSACEKTVQWEVALASLARLGRVEENHKVLANCRLSKIMCYLMKTK